VKKFFSLFFVILLAAPLVWWVVGHMRSNGDNTVRQGFPRPEAALWLDRGYYQAVEEWFKESLPAVKPLKIFHNWLNYHLFSATSVAAVHIGIHGWLYPKQTSQVLAPAVARQQGNRLFLELHTVEKMINATGRRFLVTVVPGKAAIYPEYVGSGMKGVQSPLHKALVEANGRHPLSGFIGLGPALKKAKLGGLDVYHKRSRLWTCSAAAAAAEQILNAGQLGKPPSTYPSAIACPPADDDLYRLVLGEEPRKKASLAGHAAGPHAVNGPVAVVYGDDYIDPLLPFVARAFNSMTVIDSNQEPTFGRNVMVNDSDWVVLACAENRLERLHLDLEAVYALADQPMQGMAKRDIALDRATPVTQCALDITPDGLQIRSPGEGAYFSLPPLTGSTNRVFRMVNLTFSPAHLGRVTVKIRPNNTGRIERSLNRDTRYLIIPLPFNESVEMWINPSQHPGVFILEKAELISFYDTHPPPVPAVAATSATTGNIYSGMAMQPIQPPSTDPVVDSAMQAAMRLMDIQPDLSLTDIEAGRIFQRRGNDADIVVTGTYTGVMGPVEARVVAADTNAAVVPWTVVDGSPENGLYTGILRHVPQGGWYRLQVRSGITPWVIKKGLNRWGVGLLVACIGQSNMREWFHTGQDHQPSPLLRLHRNGAWSTAGDAGNGALALGNRLAATLKIPIGLLDYSVNGTGLTAKADWGKGFWLDTGPNGIYRRFIDGVNTAGGSVEAVLWMQGEADAARGTVSREEYRAALERFVNNHIRSDIRNGSSRSQLPFLVIPLVKRPSGRDTACQRIRGAQMDALETIDECYLAALSIDLENLGRQHLAPASYSTLGIRTAQTILYLLDKVAYHRGPSVAAVARTSDRVIDLTIQHHGGSDFTPKSAITGFAVLSDQQPLPIASVARRDSNTIRIALVDEAPAGLTVRYLYGAHPDASNPVRDNTELHLPLEPFSQVDDR
jgi:hypothetical protein